MIKSESNTQLELFSQSEDSRGLKANSANNSFLTHIWNYEKIILIIIGIVITSIISYSQGVERGKRLSMLKNNFQVDTPPTIRKPLERITTEEPIKKESFPLEKEGYIIQLASYKSKSLAQKEVELLKKRGFAPQISPKGSYLVLYVGNLSNKEVAKSLLSELKKRYRDCYIRRL